VAVGPAEHLLVAVTPHGYGHVAQVAPVINGLRRRRPAARITLQTTVPQWFLSQRIQGDFQLLDQATDFGLVMDSALEIDLEGSARAYAHLHRHWERRVGEEARRLEALKPDLVLADVPCLTLAAAHRAGIPAVALCSLNWADIYRHYFSGRDEAQRVLAEMESAYNAADAFVCPEPSMPMQWLNNRVPIAPIAARGVDRRTMLNRQLDIDPATALVLVAPGGVQTRFAIERWPARQNVHWLVSAAWGVRHPDVSSFEPCGINFTDLVASCDAVLGKCGYGTVTECVANGTPLLYLPRPDWPEEQTLRDWLDDHHAGVAVPPSRLGDGEFRDIVSRARSLRVRRCVPGGAEQAAELLQRCLHAGEPAGSAG
jgi:hypothetical protein